jgi:hypothetical protein
VSGGETTRPYFACQLSCQQQQAVRLTRFSKGTMTRMKIQSLLRSAAFVVALAVATVPAFSKPLAKTINISQNTKVGKSDVKAGEYRLLIDGNKATLIKNKTTVAESEGRWEDREAKSNFDSVLLGDQGQVKEVRFSGQKRVFVFSE